MAGRGAILVWLAAVVWARCALAADDPTCAQYREPMAYNACLARHGPKANNLKGLGGEAQPGRRLKGEAGTGAQPFRRWRRSARPGGRAHMEFQIR